MNQSKRKLIEVALPLDVINEASAREKSIRHGHPSTLHLWWARRPLAACRAVLFAQLVDDPSSHPEEFPTEEAQDAERQRLFAIIEDLVKWENSNNEEVLEAARAEIRKSTGGDPPPILDPFAGGGSIPLEAQRLGLDAHASDLNPVAVLINKALIEIPPSWTGQSPVHPDAEQRMSWSGAQGLAEDVRRYGQWMRDETEKRIGHLYPKAKLEDGSEANVITWIWARTVTCPNPACGATMPLASTFWLSKKKGKEVWVKPIVEEVRVRFEIGHGPSGPPDPPKIGRGAKFRCLVCGEAAADSHIKAEGMAGRMGSQLMAIVARGTRTRFYVPASEEHEAAARGLARPIAVEQELVDDPRAIWCKRYGLTTHADLYTSRQLTALVTLVDLLHEARELVKREAHEVLADDAGAYANAVSTYLALGLSRMADMANSLCLWDAGREQSRHLFNRQAIPMMWDYAENNPLSTSAGGGFIVSLASVLDVLRQHQWYPIAAVEMGDARSASLPLGVIATDPPYYDNIGYADLADVFYVWLRLALREVYPELFSTLLTPKAEELTAIPYRHGGSRSEAESYFESGFVAVFAHMLSASNRQFPMTLFYAFKQSESDDSGLGSTGWSTMLEGLLKAGWMVTATWPMRTELTAHLKRATNALASSVVLACRPRAVDAGITDRHGLIRALHTRLPGALHELQKASIAPVDLRQAAIGPGMAVFSQYEKVVEPDSSAMRVRTALGLINQVLDQVLDEQQAEFDRETRWAIQWFSQFFEDEGPYGTAETLAVSMDVSIEGLKETGILYSGGGKVRLLSRDELSDDWDPARDARTPIWEATQYLVKRLEADGESSAGELLRQLGGVGDSAQPLATILYTKSERARPGLAGPYNALVASWPTIQRLARQGPGPSQSEQQVLTTEE